jgi:hypothetical protein
MSLVGFVVEGGIERDANYPRFAAWNKKVAGELLAKGLSSLYKTIAKSIFSTTAKGRGGDTDKVAEDD